MSTSFVDSDGTTRFRGEIIGGGWVEFDLAASSGDWQDDGVGTWTFNAGNSGIISQTDPTADSIVQTLSRYPSLEYVMQAEVRLPTGQDVATVMQAVTCAGTNDSIGQLGAGLSALVGEGATLIGAAAGDGATIDVTTFVDGSPVGISAAATPTAIVQGAWHTIRAAVSPVRQSVYVDGALVVSGESISGGNDPDKNPPHYTDLCGLGAVGLADFRNVKVWTRPLPL